MNSRQQETADEIRRTPDGAIDVRYYAAKGKGIRSHTYCAFIRAVVRPIRAGFPTLGNGPRRTGEIVAGTEMNPRDPALI